MFINNNKGISLLEVLVTMGIITVLAGVAIPAYNSYKDGVKNTAVKSDISNGRKAYLAYDAVNNSFCVNLTGAGLGGLGESDIYTGQGVSSFIGFNTTTTCTNIADTANQGVLRKSAGTGVAGGSCTLAAATFKLGAGFKKGTNTVGYSIAHNSSGPVGTSGSCDDSSKTTSDDCTGNWDHDNDGSTADQARVWTAATADVCSS